MRQALAAALLFRLAKRTKLPCPLLIGLRSDFIGQLLTQPRDLAVVLHLAKFPMAWLPSNEHRPRLVVGILEVFRVWPFNALVPHGHCPLLDLQVFDHSWRRLIHVA